MGEARESGTQKGGQAGALQKDSDKIAQTEVEEKKNEREGDGSISHEQKKNKTRRSWRKSTRERDRGEELRTPQFKTKKKTREKTVSSSPHPRY